MAAGFRLEKDWIFPAGHEAMPMNVPVGQRHLVMVARDC
jgi:hypothetical protein